MITLTRLKTDLEFNRNLGDIIDILKAAALIQFRAFQTRPKPNKGFLDEVNSFFNMLNLGGVPQALAGRGHS